MTEDDQQHETDLDRALGDGAWERVEELWLETLDRPEIPVDLLLGVRQKLFKAGQKALGITLLELLADALEERRPAAALSSLRELIRLTPKTAATRVGRLEAAFVDTWRESPSLAAVCDKYNLSDAKKPLEALEHMETWLGYDVGTVVEVQGQGVGRVIDLNLELENVKVDIGGSKPVSVPFGAVGRYLRRLEEGDFLRRRVEEPEALTEFVASDPGAALVQVLTSLGGPSSVASIKAALDGLLPPKGWTSWWTKARKHSRIVSAGTGSRLTYEVTATAASATEAMLEELAAATPRDRLAVARRLAARGPEAASTTGAFLAESLEALERSDPGLAWEVAAILADLPGGSAAAAASRGRLLASTPPGEILAGTQDRSARELVLQAVREQQPDEWPAVWSEWMVHEESGPLLETIARELDRHGDGEALDAGLEQMFRNHTDHPGAFVWCCEAMASDDAPEAIRRRRTASLLEKLPDTLSRPEFSDLRSRAKALLDPGKVAIRLLLEEANAQQATRFAQRISRLDVVEPDRQHLVAQAAARRQSVDTKAPEEPMLVATRAAVTARQAELKQLVEVEIPQTLKGINAAAAEGDLRENFEYHMLRDRQELQSAKAAKLQRELAVVRVLEPGAADVSSVNIGTVVHFDSGMKPVTILGSWDGDVENRVFANGAEVSQKLLGSKVGDPVEIDGETARIVRIEAWSG
jgi:transcription elongation GreA/GreB family factor